MQKSKLLVYLCDLSKYELLNHSELRERLFWNFGFKNPNFDRISHHFRLKSVVSCWFGWLLENFITLTNFKCTVLEAQEELNKNFICFEKLFMPTFHVAQNRAVISLHKKSRQGVIVLIHICIGGLQKVIVIGFTHSVVFVCLVACCFLVNDFMRPRMI